MYIYVEATLVWFDKNILYYGAYIFWVYIISLNEEGAHAQTKKKLSE